MKKVFNRETGKIELHFPREEYEQLPSAQKGAGEGAAPLPSPGIKKWDKGAL